MQTKEIADKLSYLEKKVLLALEGGDEASPEEIMSKGGFEKLVEVMNGVSWNQMKGLVTVEEKVSKAYHLSSKEKVPDKLPERRVLEALYSGSGESSVPDLEKNGIVSGDEVSAAIGWMKKKGWAQISKAADGSVRLKLTDDGRSMADRKGIDEKLIDDLVARGEVLQEDCDPKAVEMLRGRKGLLLERPIVTRKIRLTEEGEEILRAGLEIKDEIGQLTPEIIQSQRWRDARIREYDIEAFAPAVYAGKLHPITILINQMRDAFLKMGFTEIKGDYVESAFWNMDVLFTAQDHPVRDLHDTFYLKKPEELDIQEKDLVEIIRQVHENGWKTGSKGWGNKWSFKEAQKMLLRTHTTVNTIRYLSKHNEPPIKVFSIGRVFRNESIDIRHLPEFTQVEGIVCEEHADMNMLVTVLKEFYRAMGIEDVRIRPGYFPYTEPSLEVDILYSGKWMELGGAGIFRPEVTEPHGVKSPVLAWGLGLERLAMLRWKLNDIRELYVSDMDWLRKASTI
jgi:phenylalanyl-tRNA synthetase alpha chain